MPEVDIVAYNQKNTDTPEGKLTKTEPMERPNISVIWCDTTNGKCLREFQI